MGWRESIVDVLKTMVMGTKGRRRAIEEASDAADGKVEPAEEIPEPTQGTDTDETEKKPKETAKGFRKRMAG